MEHRSLHLVTELFPRGLVELVHANVLLNDKAHDWNHVMGVVEHADKIVSSFEEELGSYRKMILAGAFMHDGQCHVDRKGHHELGAKWVLNEVFPYWDCDFTDAEQWIVAQSILEHRASWECKRINPVSEAVAAADRGPVSFRSYLKRAIQYRTSNGISPNNESMRVMVISDAFGHIQDKFSSRGYAFKNASHFTMRLYKKEIAELHAAIDEVNPEAIVALGEELLVELGLPQ